MFPRIFKGPFPQKPTHRIYVLPASAKKHTQSGLFNVRALFINDTVKILFVTQAISKVKQIKLSFYIP